MAIWDESLPLSQAFPLLLLNFHLFFKTGSQYVALGLRTWEEQDTAG